MRMLCPSALNFMLFHLASDRALAFFVRTSPFFVRNSSTLHRPQKVQEAVEKPYYIIEGYTYIYLSSTIIM